MKSFIVTMLYALATTVAAIPLAGSGESGTIGTSAKSVQEELPC
jgi:hypothetical protein